MNDGWTEIIRNLLVIGEARMTNPDLSPAALMQQMELADFEKMEQIRARVDSVVEGQGDGGSSEAILPPVLQATVHPQRVPPDLQSSRTSRWWIRRAREWIA